MIKLTAVPKKYLITSALIVAVAAGGLTAALNQPQQTGADTSPLTQEVDRQGQQLNNHEARISNLENNQKDIQSNTNTPPSSTQAVVPPANTTQTVVSTPITTTDPTPAPTQPTPVTVTKSVYYTDVYGDNHCNLTYSDSSIGTAPIDQKGDCTSYIGQGKN